MAPVILVPAGPVIPVAPVGPNSFVLPVASVINTLPAVFAESLAVPRKIVEPPTCKDLKAFPVAPKSKAISVEGTNDDTR